MGQYLLIFFQHQYYDDAMFLIISQIQTEIRTVYFLIGTDITMVLIVIQESSH